MRQRRKEMHQGDWVTETFHCAIHFCLDPGAFFFFAVACLKTQPTYRVHRLQQRKSMLVMLLLVCQFAKKKQVYAGHSRKEVLRLHFFR